MVRHGETVEEREARLERERAGTGMVDMVLGRGNKTRGRTNPGRPRHGTTRTGAKRGRAPEPLVTTMPYLFPAEPAPTSKPPQGRPHKGFAPSGKKRGRPTFASRPPQVIQETAPVPASTGGIRIRFGRNFGNMGAISDQLIIEVRMEPWAKGLLVNNKVMNLHAIRAGLVREIYRPLHESMDTNIDIVVPKDTGDLRDAMHDSIDGGHAAIDRFSDNNPWRLKLGTKDVWYARVVNKMPTSWLRHPKPNKRNRGRYGDSLVDPTAKRGWFGIVRDDGRQEAQLLYNNFINNIIMPVLRPLVALGIVGNATTEARRMFPARFR